MSEPQEFNDGHIVEGMDRCNTILVMIHELLDQHPAVVKANVGPLVQKAADLIMSSYQLIGNLEDQEAESSTPAQSLARVKAEALRDVARVQLDPEGWRCIDHQGLMQEADRLEAEAGA